MADPITTSLIVAGLATAAGTGISAAGTIAAGRSRQSALQQEGLNAAAAAEFNAQQLDIKAKQERASAQQEGFQIRRNKRLALSRLQARAAGERLLSHSGNLDSAGDYVSIAVQVSRVPNHAKA